MNILGIETSSPVCSVGCVNDRGWSVERSIEDPHIHSEKLLTLTKEVLKQAESDLENLDAVAVSIGPGSFTGLRIGLSTAKGLCFALTRSLIEIPTFDAIAQAAFESNPNTAKVLVAVDAKQGEFYCGLAKRRHDGSPPSMDVRTQRLDDIAWLEWCDNGSLCVTDRAEIIRGHGIPVELIGSYNAFCRGDVVARLAMTKYLKGDFADLASIEPMYLKDFVVKKAII
jgi:tRNA threonylcarbamoyladenosine biosynthesis protein TsaB